jgi:hypothetical protein
MVYPLGCLTGTESPLVALYFAVIDEPKKDGAVWCLDPVEINQLAGLKQAHPSDLPCFDVDDGLKGYEPTELHLGPPSTQMSTVAAIGRRTSVRQYAQLGVFTIAHRTITAIEKLGKTTHVWRFVVPASKKKAILEELAFLNVNELTLFPELSRVANVTKELVG